VFSWDARKAIGNLRKHDVSFEEAATIFSETAVDPDRLLRCGANPFCGLCDSKAEK
jgi:uncharacterized DUF497 family protein